MFEGLWQNSTCCPFREVPSNLYWILVADRLASICWSRFQSVSVLQSIKPFVLSRATDRGG